jgi:class 3 adenylate cyclase
MEESEQVVAVVLVVHHLTEAVAEPALMVEQGKLTDVEELQLQGAGQTGSPEQAMVLTAQTEELKYIGDGVMATFNLSGEDDNDGTNEDAISAVNAALDFREAFKYYLDWYWHEEWNSIEPIEFGLKCGISTGNVIYFIVGTEGKGNAAGPTVNLESRFAGLANKDNDILISQTTEARVGTKLFVIDNEISVETLLRKKSLGNVQICFPVRGKYSREGSSGR